MFYASIDALGKVNYQSSKAIVNSNWSTSHDETLLTFKSPGIFSFGFPVRITGKDYLHHFQLEKEAEPNAACMGSDTTGIIYTDFFKTIPYNWAWDAEYSDVLTEATANITMEDVPMYKEEICFSKAPPKNYFSLGKDTILCPGDSLQLQSSYPYKSYTWQDESTDSVLIVTSPGIYSLTAQDNCDYKYYDTIKIDNTPKNYFSLGKDTVLCPGSSLQLQTSYTYKSFTWQDNTTDSVFTVSAPGLYSLIAQDNCDYKYYDTIKIDYSATNLTLENNYVICKGDVARLTLPPGFQPYWWQPQTEVAAKNNVFEFSPDKTTQYIIAAKNAIGCVSTDSITVEVKNCPNKFFMPSAFTPNMDGKNEIFKPFVEGMLLSYKLSIYNRWGNKIFDTDNPAQGWDGKLKGVQQSSNIYIWVSQYQFKGEQIETKKGSFVLIR
jgi:gliding motility-associated-like protein